jgi:hypothetical protein
MGVIAGTSFGLTGGCLTAWWRANDLFTEGRGGTFEAMKEGADRFYTGLHPGTVGIC